MVLLWRKSFNQLLKSLFQCNLSKYLTSLSVSNCITASSSVSPALFLSSILQSAQVVPCFPTPTVLMGLILKTSP